MRRSCGVESSLVGRSSRTLHHPSDFRLVFQLSAPEVFPYVLNYGTAWLSDIR